MKIGVLNELVSDIKCTTSMKKGMYGNPAKNEELLIKWFFVRNNPAELYFDFSQVCFVDRVEVVTGKATNLKSLVLKDEQNTLYTYNAETGKAIREKSIFLEAASTTDKLTLCIESDFSDVEILSVKFYGGLFDEKDVFPTPDKIDFSGKIIPVSRAEIIKIPHNPHGIHLFSKIGAAIPNTNAGPALLQKPNIRSASCLAMHPFSYALLMAWAPTG